MRGRRTLKQYAVEEHDTLWQPLIKGKVERRRRRRSPSPESKIRSRE